MRSLRGIAIAACLCVAPAAISQTVEVNRQNKTVEVTVTQKVSLEAEVANVTIGCVEYGLSHDSAFQENLRIANQVLKALLSAGVPKENITSGKVELNENQFFNPESKDKSLSERRFIAHQSWVVHVRAIDAQKVVDLAVQAGANGIESVSWDVLDQDTLESRARTSALEKAHTIAEEIAKSNGGKVGQAIYISNQVEGKNEFSRFQLYSRLFETAYDGSAAPPFKLQLFPDKVTEEATAHVIYTLE